MRRLGSRLANVFRRSSFWGRIASVVLLCLAEAWMLQTNSFTPGVKPEWESIIGFIGAFLLVIGIEIGIQNQTPQEKEILDTQALVPSMPSQDMEQYKADNADQALFREFVKDFSFKPGPHRIIGNRVYQVDYAQEFESLVKKWHTAEKEFLDSTLREAQREFLMCAGRFLEKISIYRKEESKETEHEMERAQNDAIQAHQTLIRQARHKFKTNIS